MDLFELLIFALIAGSGLIGELLKKKRRREAREQAQRAKDSSRPSDSAASERDADDGVAESWDPADDGAEDVFDFETILQDTLFGGSSKRRDLPSGPEPVSGAEPVEAQPSLESVRRMGRIEVRSSRENVRLDLMDGSSDARDPSIPMAPVSGDTLQDRSNGSTSMGGHPSARRSRYIGMLSKPSGFRDAVVLSELLRRPTSRRRRL